MPVRIFTIPFHEETQTFHDDLLQQFCVNKQVHKIETRFFTRNHQPFWTVAIHYGAIFSEGKGFDPDKRKNEEAGLDEQQKVLLLRLKEWRREAGDTVGLPVFLIASNRHLIDMILHKCVSLESLKLIKGFGDKRIQKYGKGINAIIKTFYQPS